MVPAKKSLHLSVLYIKCGGTGWINGEEDVMVPSLLSRQNAPLVLGVLAMVDRQVSSLINTLIICLSLRRNKVAVEPANQNQTFNHDMTSARPPPSAATIEITHDTSHVDLDGAGLTSPLKNLLPLSNNTTTSSSMHHPTSHHPSTTDQERP